LPGGAPVSIDQRLIRTGTQSIERASLIMRVLASRNGAGVRLIDVTRCTKLEHSTVHRILKCLVAEKLVYRNPHSRRYHLGHLIFEFGLAAASEFNLRAVCQPSMTRLAEKTGDTVFLSVRSGFDTVCLDRREGSFPIKTLTLDVGTRRPLGVGAIGIALIMLLSDTSISEILNATARQLVSYGDLTVPGVQALVHRARGLGFAVNDRPVTPGAISVGMAIRSKYGAPFLALSIGAISSRMGSQRQQEIAEMLKQEITMLEGSLNEYVHPL